MKTLFAGLQSCLPNTFLPHYKEDAFRGIFAGIALRSGWTLAEPRQANKQTIPSGKTAVYLLKWKHGSIEALPSTVDVSPNSKPDIRLFSPSGEYFKGEFKCGFSGSASEGNSNATKIAKDVDLVSSRECDFFCGLFDTGMLNRIQGRLSSAGRGADLKGLLGDITMPQLHQERRLDRSSEWEGLELKTSVVAIVCSGGIKLALVLVRASSAKF